MMSRLTIQCPVFDNGSITESGYDIHCVSKNVPPLTCYNLDIHGLIAIILAQVLPRKQAIKMYSIFPPHLACASALPGETGNPKIASFHLNVACFLPKKHIKI